MSDPNPDLLDPFEDAEWLPARELFRRLGFEPLPSSAVDEFQLPGRLWELVYAMAGRRFYLGHTDHLTNRQLYAWLSDEWLEEEVADIPPEADWNCHLDGSDFGNGLDPIVWLRYFASEEERRSFAAEHHLKSIPAHEDPPCDRDRWLPTLPGVAEDDEDDEGDGPFPSEEDEDSDPLGLARVDAEIRAERERQRTLANPGDQVLAGWQRPIDALPRTGESLLPPDELTDETITAALWELLHHLACRAYYVLHTDHLSDRALYRALWETGLREAALMPGKRCCTGGWFHDCVGSGSEEDAQLWLRFYATEEERAEQAREFPAEPMPPREQPAFNRDWRLPQGPF